MWIRMTHTAAGPRLPRTLEADKIYSVSDELGEEMIAARAAKEVANPAPKKPEPASETAAIEEGETGADPNAEKKAENLIDRLKPPQKTAAKK